MTYATLYPTKAAALAAAAAYVKKIRPDWNMVMRKVTHGPDFIQPCQRPETGCFRSFVIEGGGLFSRCGEIQGGEACFTALFAYPVNPQGAPEYKVGRLVAYKAFGKREVRP